MMFGGLFRKKRRDYILDLDIHSHILPNIDDGSKSLDDTMKMILALRGMGYKKLITTPHIMNDFYQNSYDSIKKALDVVEQRLVRDDIDITLDVGAEYYLDDGFLDKVKRDDLMLINKKYLLFETSYQYRPIHLEESVFEILSLGYTPVLAHPERYNYIDDIDREYARLKSLGVLFQLNINSFNGYYGSRAKFKAIYLSRNGMVDFLGSDTHNFKQIENLKRVFKSREYSDIFKYNNIKNGTLF